MINLNAIQSRAEECGYRVTHWASGMWSGLNASKDSVSAHIASDGYFYILKDNQLCWSIGQRANIDEAVKKQFNYIIFGR